MKTNKVIIAKNPDGKINSISVMDNSHKVLSTLLATNDPSDERGRWFRQLNSVLIDTEFTVTESILVDLPECSPNQTDYFDSVIPKLVDEIIHRHKLDIDINHMIHAEPRPVTEYIQLSHYLDSAHMIPSPHKSFKHFAKQMDIKGITYLIQHVDRRADYFAEYAMAVQYMNDHRIVKLTFDVEEYLTMIAGGRFVYGGELYTSNCLHRPGELNHQLTSTVERKIHRIMTNIAHIPVNERKLDAIFL